MDLQAPEGGFILAMLGEAWAELGSPWCAFLPCRMVRQSCSLGSPVRLARFRLTGAGEDELGSSSSSRGEVGLGSQVWL